MLAHHAKVEKKTVLHLCIPAGARLWAFYRLDSFQSSSGTQGMGHPSFKNVETGYGSGMDFVVTKSR